MKNNEQIKKKSNSITKITCHSHVIRFSGDSGDGIQIVGAQMTETSAILGNDVKTFPNFPAEIRAPAGSLRGISSFQLCFSKKIIYTAGDSLNTLVALNPAALKTNILDLKSGGILLTDVNRFTKKELRKAGFKQNPLVTQELDNYRIFSIPMTTLVLKAVKKFKLSHSKACRCKTLFALGVIYWIYERTLDRTIAWLEKKFKNSPILEPNKIALKTGYNFAETTDLFSEQYQIPQAHLLPGRYRHLTGNQTLALGIVSAASQVGKIFVAGYPITPASDILHQLTHYLDQNVIIFQAEDEISAVTSALGASFGGTLSVCCTSGPGLDLKEEGIGLGVMAELPLVVVNVTRAGPSTGMPTKTEQSDLLAAIMGRHGECPVVVLAPATPSDCFTTILEALYLAVKYMTPVIVLSDATLANSAEPWSIPDPADITKIPIKFLQEGTHFDPYRRDAKTLSRSWVRPGTQNLMHRIGGLEKQAITGEISYDLDNHQSMVHVRADKIKHIANEYSKLKVFGNKNANLLLISWGSLFGPVRAATKNILQEGYVIAHIHLRHLYPLPKDLGEIIIKFSQILVP